MQVLYPVHGAECLPEVITAHDQFSKAGDGSCDHAGTDKVCRPCQMRNPQHPSTDPPEDTWSCRYRQSLSALPNEEPAPSYNGSTRRHMIMQVQSLSALPNEEPTASFNGSTRRHMITLLKEWSNGYSFLTQIESIVHGSIQWKNQLNCSHQDSATDKVFLENSKTRDRTGTTH